MKQIASALVKAQKEFGPALKSSTNPHFKSHFATLASVMDAIREPFAENGLAVVQPTVWIDNKLFIKPINPVNLSNFDTNIKVLHSLNILNLLINFN